MFERAGDALSNLFVKTKTWYFGAAFKATPNPVEGTIARYDWAAIRLRLPWQQVLSKISTRYNQKHQGI
jgi:hypothetical protein